MIINVKAEPGLIRNETFQEQDHIVIPMVGLVEGVMLSANADEPALALAEEFGKHVAGWNGRPVVINHPKDTKGNPVSANSPEILENEQIGQLFNSELSDKKLKFEAWINISTAEEKGDEGKDVVERLRSGELMEISTGLFAEEEQKKGAHLGVPFDSIWRNIVPDHLALLPNGIGACSIADGCGAPRINEGKKFCCIPCSRGELCENERKSRFSEFLKHLGIKENRTDFDVRLALQAALGETRPNEFAFVHAVMNDNTFIFETWDGFFQQSFEIEEDGTIALGDEPVKVRPETNFVPVKVKENNVDKTEKVNALISSDTVSFEEGDREYLEGLEEDRLDIFLKKPETPAVNDDPSNDPADPKDDPITAEQYIKDAPAEVAEVLQHGMELRTQQRDHLVKGVLANSKNTFTEEELKDMPMAALEKMASLAEVDDFTARGGPRSIQSLDTGHAPTPPLVFEVGKKQTA